MSTNNPTIEDFIFEQQKTFAHSTGEFSQIMSTLVLAAKYVHKAINNLGLGEMLGTAGKENIQGEQQQKLDVYANELFKCMLSKRGHVCGIASEEEDSFVDFGKREQGCNQYVVAFDPVDGSSNIDCTISVGTIFSIYKRLSAADQPLQESDFLQKGLKLVAAGYFIYGSSTMLVFSTGQGVNGFTLESSIGSFFLSHKNIKLPNSGEIYSINDSLSSSFAPGLSKFIEQCRNQGFTTRYTGSLIADFHRTLLKGGIYIYPATKNFPEGKLRLLYECKPLAFIAEQAGGLASDGEQAILQIQPKQLHQRSALIFGSEKLVVQLLHSYSLG